MKVGLVLGAGGVAGGAWLTGALQAIATETGWDPGSADRIVGTSAGSVIGAFTAAGLPPWFMVAHSKGETFEGLTGPDGRPAADADRSGGAVFRLHRGLPSVGPGSLKLGLSTLARPRRHTPLELTVGWLPRGVMSTDPISDIVRRTVPWQWVDHPSFWAVACDYASGRRVGFGRPGAPDADLADAVAASCSIPGFYRPVEIGGRRYVDGGVRSASNLDLVAGLGLDLVICLNPTSTRVGGGAGIVGLHPLDRVLGLNRAASGRRLGSEARRVRAGGTEVVLIQPGSEDLAVIGRNMMSGKRRNEVIETAIRTVGRAVRLPGIREQLTGLPQGEAHKIERPSGPPEQWPDIVPTAPLSARAA
ncbi:MAG TPA: patatin-like phospholipase family protein [Thermoleophilaceae bacterium]|nr:patatin-like phospholipase family protein [Thermoleophilaceae bacterium]